MAQFAKNDFDIPDDFLQAHESGKVVFFCGAGISRPHLPGFDGLVQKLFDRFGIPEGGKDARKQKRYEVAVELLDKTIAGERPRVRKEISHILTPGSPICPVIHRSLLHLARTSGGQMRLVTTNFDRFFERAMIDDKRIKRYLPPALPVPKREWGGVVYLHGLLPEKGENGLDDMVISSADFGRAYILEQWAANFVRELFRNYSVCFVGYGINDPVMRYLLDALAADRLSGVPGKEMYAFADYHLDKKDASDKEWKYKETAVWKEWQGKGVTPILYRNKDKNDHALLHDTLREWANIYKQGTEGKKVIIDRHVKSPPPESAKGFVAGQMLWATTDTIAAKHFANLNPVPPLNWLNVFGDKCMGLVSRGHSGNDGKLDDAALPMAEWLLRHLENSEENPELICWFAKHGGKLHSIFARMVGFRINKMSPSPGRTLWDLLLSGRIGDSDIFDIHDWKQALMRDGPSFAVKSRLRDMLSPRITVNERSFFAFGDNTPNPPVAPEHASDIVHCSLKLRAQGMRDKIRQWHNDPQWKELLPLMLDDFTALLRDAMGLMREVGKADDRRDGSYLALPSIAEHRQNNLKDNWTALPKLARDAWLATEASDPIKALRVAEGWQQTPYPIFKRLAFFAASHNSVILERKGLDWLLADNDWWLWTGETKRESIRLMVALAPQLNAKDVCRLTSAILKHPPREMYSSSATDKDYAVWLRLAKVQAAGITMDKAAQNELDALNGKYPRKVAEDERDEFPYWSSGVVSVGDNLPPGYVHPPKTASELAEWLKVPPVSGWYSDDSTWRGYCANHCDVTIAALEILAKQKIYPAERWSGALWTWGEGDLLQKSWRVAPILAKASDDMLQVIVHSVSDWLCKQGKKVPEKGGALFLRLIRRIIGLSHESDDTNDKSLSHMLDSPMGTVTHGLMHWLFRQGKPKLSGNIRRLLTDLCDTAKAEYRPVRAALVAHAKDILCIDEKWAKQNLLPLFDWHKSAKDARVAWYVFLQSHTYYLPLLAEIKHHFLYTATQLDELGDMTARQYADALTLLALYRGKKPLSRKELREATEYLPDEELCRAADTICDKIVRAEKRGKYWRSIVAPYFKWVWPQQQAKVKIGTARQIARICTETGEEFADAAQQLKYFLMPLDDPNDAYYGLSEHGLCGKFPRASLFWLNAVTSDAPVYWIAEQLRKFLDEIRQTDSGLVNSPEYTRLDRICQKYGF